MDDEVRAVTNPNRQGADAPIMVGTSNLSLPSTAYEKSYVGE